MKKLLTPTLALAFVALLALPARAQVGLGLNGQYGLDFEEFQLGGEIHVPVGFAGFRFVPNFEYYLRDEPTTFSINADFHYAIGAQYTRNFTPYVGLGLGVTRVSRNDNSNTEAGLNLIGGANFNTGSTRPFFQIEYRAGNYSDLSIGGGVRFTMQ